jgi:hypothetical protein
LFASSITIKTGGGISRGEGRELTPPAAGPEEVAGFEEVAIEKDDIWLWPFGFGVAACECQAGCVGTEMGDNAM